MKNSLSSKQKKLLLSISILSIIVFAYTYYELYHSSVISGKFTIHCKTILTKEQVDLSHLGYSMEVIPDSQIATITFQATEADSDSTTKINLQNLSVQISLKKQRNGMGIDSTFCLASFQNNTAPPSTTIKFPYSKYFDFLLEFSIVDNCDSEQEIIRKVVYKQKTDSLKIPAGRQSHKIKAQKSLFDFFNKSTS